MKQTSKEYRTAALEAKLGISFQPKEGDAKKMKRETSKEVVWGEKQRASCGNSPGIR